MLFFMRFFCFLMFFSILFFLIKKSRIYDLFVLFLSLSFVLLGEVLNLFIYKVAIYNGVIGIPVYIIFAGSIISFGTYKLAFFLEKFIPYKNIWIRCFIICFISFFLPVFEFLGLKLGLWHWTRNYNLSFLLLYMGVFIFYFKFLTLPALIGLFFKRT